LSFPPLSGEFLTAVCLRYLPLQAACHSREYKKGSKITDRESLEVSVAERFL
jgi:hypothetical protein